jgi:hypothetical protein
VSAGLRVGFVEWPDELQPAGRDWALIAQQVSDASIDVLITNELPFGLPHCRSARRRNLDRELACRRQDGGDRFRMLRREFQQERGWRDGPSFGGAGFAYLPDGTLAGTTTATDPLLVVEVETEVSVRRRGEYPCYVFDPDAAPQP